MSIVYTEITLKNAYDVEIEATGIVKDHKVRETTVKAVVDTGAWTLVINEEVRQLLGLRKLTSKTGTLTDGSKIDYYLASPLQVNWKNRSTTCEALVLPNAKNILMGAIPLEAMDLMIHPRKEEIVGAHGDEEVHLIL